MITQPTTTYVLLTKIPTRIKPISYQHTHVIYYVTFCIYIALISFSITALPQKAHAILLSDIAYHSFKKDLQDHKKLYEVLLNSYEKSFTSVQIHYKNHTYNIPYKKHSSSRLSLKLPIFFTKKDAPKETIKIIGINQNKQRIWQRQILHPSIDTSLLSPLRVIEPFQTFRGHMVFADAIERLSQYFVEPQGQENITFIRAVDHQLHTVFIRFIEDLSTKKPIFEAIGVYANFENLYYFTKKYAAQLSLTNTKKTHFDIDISCPNRLSLTPQNQDTAGNENNKNNEEKQLFYTIRKTDNQLELQFYADSCEPASSKLKTTHFIKLPHSLKDQLKELSISAYSLEKALHQDEVYYLILLKTQPEHNFVQKHISDDFALVLTKHFIVDGVIAMKNRYYSPRKNIAYFHQFHEFLNYYSTPL
ncbi:MAG: hypothetical protein OXC44_05910 [Proteobacteria bacterium]|nr:hypothetical protein [Pseudomonadota bacterium]